MKNKEYFNFILSKVENDLKVYPSSGELLKCLYLIGVLKSSESILKEIYTISRIRNLKNLGNYLLFVFKKVETGEIKFDNLLENLNLDKEFILNELHGCFDIKSSAEEENKSGQEKEKSKPEETKEEKISSEIKRILSESKFKVEEIDNELVTEEFIESDTKTNDELIVRGNYLELIQPENEFEDISVFTLPTDKTTTDAKEEIQELENDVFSLPSSGNKIEIGIPVEEFLDEQINIEEIEEVKIIRDGEQVGEDVSTSKPEEKIMEDVIKTEEVSEEITVEQTIEEKEFIPEELIPEIEPEEPIISEAEKEKTVFIEIQETKEKIENIISEESDEQKENIEIAEVENSVYMKYETELLTSNVLLRNSLDELGNLKAEDENYQERKKILLKEIIDSSAYMEEYSKKMSFEVITSIYNIISMTFLSYGKTVGIEIVALFKDSINLVESLIKGEDFEGYDNVIKSLDVLKNTLIDIKKDESKEIKQKEERVDISEEETTVKQYDTNDRQKLSLIKQNIIEVENIFKSIEEIKGKYQAYEALRRLSHSFAHFKELVNIANSLDLRKLAQLAEASYIFVKFIQNYRMNPFESEVAEVFKYIIYNFKLIFLDKPTKDIDLLISYLNDPVKIFEKKEKK